MKEYCIDIYQRGDGHEVTYYSHFGNDLIKKVYRKILYPTFDLAIKSIKDDPYKLEFLENFKDLKNVKLFVNL